jgi:hypothetical protein
MYLVVPFNTTACAYLKTRPLMVIQQNCDTIGARMELKDYFLVLGPLVGILIGGGITTVTKWIELRHQWKLERSRIHLERLERLHFALGELMFALEDVAVLTIQLKTQKNLDERQEASRDLVLPISKYLVTIESLSCLFAPALANKASSLNDYWTDMTSAILNYLKESHDAADRGNLHSSLQAMINHAEEIQSALTNEVRLLESKTSYVRALLRLDSNDDKI